MSTIALGVISTNQARSLYAHRIICAAANVARAANLTVPVQLRMSVITLSQANRATVHTLLADNMWCIACLCAGWCTACAGFRASFEALAAHHPDKVMLWIDIEDEAEVVGDFDIDNFPTLLIQRGTEVAFLGTIEPNQAVAHRLVQAQTKARQTIHPTHGLNGAKLAFNPDLRARLAALISG